MKKIDIHIHSTFFKEAKISKNINLALPEEIIKTYDKLDIEKGLLLPLISPENRFSIQTNEEMQAITEKFPDRFAFCCNLDPRMGDNNEKTDFSEMINYYKTRGAVGFGELTANLPIDDAMMQNLFYHCGECDMPVIIHVSVKKGDFYGIIDDEGLTKLEKTLKKYPKLKILGHSSPFWSEISKNPSYEERIGYPEGKVTEGRIAEIMRECPNLYCDLSAGSGCNALSRDNDYAYKFIEEFSDRLLFGTDMCYANQELPLTDWLDTAYKQNCINEENYRKICRENAIKLFNL